jgi:hypothetical protein
MKKDLFKIAKKKALKAVNEKIRFLTGNDKYYHNKQIDDLLRERQGIKFTTESKSDLVGFFPMAISLRERGKFRSPSRNKILRDNYLNRK